MDLNEVAVFVGVVRAGSFSAAARRLGMPKSTVSARVSALEKRLGATLIRRTTRKLAITPAGQAFFERGQEALGVLETAEAEVRAGQAEPQGTLRLTAPSELGAVLLPPVIQHFRKLHPKVRLEIDLSDREVDLLAEGVDLAIRVGKLPDSGLIAKRLGTVYFAPFASQKYLSRAGVPREPAELRRHSCLRFRPLEGDEWRLSGPGGSVRVEAPAALVANNLALLKALAASGQGIALLPTFLCLPELQQAKLVRILPGWRAHVAPVQFVHSPQRFPPPPLKAFMEAGGELIRSRIGDFEL